MFLSMRKFKRLKRLVISTGLILLITLSNSFAEDLKTFDNSFSISGGLGYSLPLSPTGSNSYSESYFPGWLFGGGVRYSFSSNFAIGVFYDTTSTSHRTDPSAKVSFSPIYLESLISVASTDNERIFLIAGAGYSKNKVEGSKTPSEWSGAAFIGGAGFEYLLSSTFGFEINLKGFGFLPAGNDYDLLGISSLGMIINLYL